MAKKILGKYIITANLPFPEYTFTGNDRNASMELNADTRLDFRCGYVRGIYEYVRFVADNVLFIKKARIVTHGAAGLRSMYRAATLNFFSLSKSFLVQVILTASTIIKTIVYKTIFLYAK